MRTTSRRPAGVVHLELHTSNSTDALGFLSPLLGWRSASIVRADSAYLVLGMGPRIGGGVVECGIGDAQWMPYVRVAGVQQTTEYAGRLGATVLLEPRQGPSGWRSVVATPSTGAIAFWQPTSRWSR